DSDSEFDQAVTDEFLQADLLKRKLSDQVVVSQDESLVVDDGVSVDESDFEEMSLSAKYACTDCDLNFDAPSPQLFSFNTPRGMCSYCGGLGELHSFDPDLLIPNKSRSFQQGCFIPIGKWRDLSPWKRHIFQGVADALEQKYNLEPHTVLETAWEELLPEVQKEILWGTGDLHITFNWRNGYTSHKWGGKFEGIIPKLLIQYRETKSKMQRLSMEKYMRVVPCSYCNGDRLNEQARSFRLETECGEFEQKKVSLPELCRLSITDTQKFLANLVLTETGRMIANDALKEIRNRLGFLVNVGLGYLSLSRTSPTLSGGELQRIRLASQIGSGLVGVLYILDEPSIGLHPRDNDQLLATIAKLRDLGNTVIVVEHDEDTMNAADMLVDFGPGPGIHGGQIVANISTDSFDADKIKSDIKNSLTLKFLTGVESIPVPQKRRPITSRRKLVIRGASHNNLKNVDVEIPLGAFVCVTGVSGSGKSSLINDILVEALNRDLNRGYGNPGKHDRIDGIDQLDKMIAIDQSPIGRGSHSNPATYIRVFDEIRALFAELPDAKLKGYEPGRFSFNVRGGRCEACEGRGTQKLEMDFLADVYVTCPACQGHRFNIETLAIRYKGKSIDQVLNMAVEEAIEHFENHPRIKHYLSMLSRVGLGYMKLGQPSPTLSGGEAQRIKLAKELVKRSTGKTLYLLDEPTTGLHFSDIKMLLGVLHEFADAGNTVLVVEHNLDVIKTADWIIDLGPEGGDDGGKIIATGTPEDVIICRNSYTGQALKKYFNKTKHLNSINTKSENTDNTTKNKNEFAKKKNTNQERSLFDIYDDSDNSTDNELITNASNEDASLNVQKVSLGLLLSNSMRQEPLLLERGESVRLPDVITVRGAYEHNLKEVSVEIMRDKMTIFSGQSGSGKSSLALDTIYAEGQRRYVESLSSYARQFIGQLQKPHVERIDGLSPAIAIEQKAASHSPRSTVGTITEIQDYLRVLFARLGVPYCPNCNIPIGTQTLDEIIGRIMSMPTASRLLIAAPLNIDVGQIYTDIWKRFRLEGFNRVRIDGLIYSLSDEAAIPEIDRRRRHDVELVVDRVVLRDDQSSRIRIADSVESALTIGQGVLHVIEVDDAVEETRWKRSIHSQHLACEKCGRSFERLTPHHFSANSPMGWCPNCEGLGVQQGANPAVFIKDTKLTIEQGAIKLFPNVNNELAKAMLTALAKYAEIPIDVPFEQLDARHRRLLYHGTGELDIHVKYVTENIDNDYDKISTTKNESKNAADDKSKNESKNESVSKPKSESKSKSKSESNIESNIDSESEFDSESGDKLQGVAGNDLGVGFGREVRFSFQYKGLYPVMDEASRLVPFFRGGVVEDVLSEVECGVCLGSRLRDDVSAVRFIGYTMDQICRFPLGKLLDIFRGLVLGEMERQVAGDLLNEVMNRLQFLVDVGLDYLTLSRSAPTLSGGETQRIRLAAQIGSGLVGVLYVLDEPTIGLHVRDNRKLVDALRKLRDLGNTLIVVEHDKEVILGADQILDFGPKAGKYGGEIVAQGTPQQIIKQKNSVTGNYLNGKKQIPIPTNRRITTQQSNSCPTKKR
ncbi:MAG: excinuclease ABC subunit UvrA, partial [Planctomycetaceae bacterium]|nr:excinuclease ABC subunit UvrA [Planctomycetaceae bacterium]